MPNHMTCMKKLFNFCFHFESLSLNVVFDSENEIAREKLKFRRNSGMGWKMRHMCAIGYFFKPKSFNDKFKKIKFENFVENFLSMTIEKKTKKTF